MKFYIGMPLEDALKLTENDVSHQDMKNGYYWLRGNFTLFGESTYMSLCFKDGLLWMMDIAPHYNRVVDRQPFEVLNSDKKFCREWLEKHKGELPKSAEYHYDIRTPSVGIIIR